MPRRLVKALSITAALAAAVPALAAEPAQRTLPIHAGDLVQLLGGLVVVLLAIGASVWALRRFGRVPGGGAGAVRVLGGVSLGTRERALLVQVGETQLLVGVAPGRVQTLHVLERPLPAPEAGAPFAERLGQVLGRAGRRGGAEAGQ